MQTKEQISLELDEIDKKIETMEESLDVLQVEKHNMTIQLETITEGIRKQRLLIKKSKTAKEIKSRSYWRST